MATLETFTVTLADTSSMTAEEGAQIAIAMANMIINRFKNDSRVTAMAATYLTKAITIAVT